MPLFKKIYYQAKRELEQVKCEIKDESKMHFLVRDLYDNVKATHGVYKSKLAPEVQNAAQHFIYELGLILDNDSKNPWSKTPRFQYQLAEQTMAIIYKYQPSLESAPGFWNQLKAYINTFIERLIGIENALNTTPTKFSEDVGFQRYKKNIMVLKQDIESSCEQKTSFNPF